ncbi:hypothetical protein SALBM311S_01035 [Streptomyces alboniger]
MSPAGAASAAPTMAPPSAAANSLALAGSRPMISTAWPPASPRSARAPAMFPRPIMLMLLMEWLLSGGGWNGMPTPAVVNGCVVNAVE